MAGLVLLAALAGPAAGQWLEETILLPDSLGGLVRPQFVEVDTLANEVYIAGGYEAQVPAPLADDQPTYVIIADGTTGKKMARVQVVGMVTALCYSQALRRVYAAHRNSGTVSVIDATSRSVVAVLPVPTRFMCLNERTRRLYCAGEHDSLLTVVDVAANEVLYRIPLPGDAWQPYCNPGGTKVYCQAGLYSLAVIDADSDTLLAGIQTPFETEHICFNPIDNKVYCSGIPANCVTILDGAGDSVITEVPVGCGPREVCHNPANNMVYVACGGTDSVWVIDGASNEVTDRVLLHADDGFAPGRLCYNPRANKVYCIGDVEDNHLWEVFVIDCGTNRVLAHLPSPEFTFAFACNPRSNRVFAVNHLSDDVTVIDCARDSVLGRVLLGCRPTSLCYNSREDKVYCATEHSRVVFVIDCATNEVSAVVPVGALTFDFGICYNPAMNKVYCPNSDNRSVTVIDGAVDTVLATLLTGRGLLYSGFSPDVRSKVYVTDLADTSVSVIDGAGDSVMARVPVGAWTRYLCYNSADHKMYFSRQFPPDESYTTIIDARADTVLGSLSLGGYGMGYNPTGNKVYIGGFSDSVYILDGHTDTVIGAVAAGVRPFWHAFCHNDTDDKVYMSSFGFGCAPIVLVLDGVTDSIRAVLWLDGKPQALSFNRMNDKVYATSRDDKRVAIIDGVSDSVIARIGVGADPCAMAWSPRQNRTFVANHLGSSISVIRDSIVQGVAESPPVVVTPEPRPTILRNVLVLPRDMTDFSSGKSDCVPRHALMDACGRKVLDLHAGKNDISHLSPGVYFWKDRRTDRVGRVVLVK